MNRVFQRFLFLFGTTGTGSTNSHKPRRPVSYLEDNIFYDEVLYFATVDCTTRQKIKIHRAFSGILMIAWTLTNFKLELGIANQYQCDLVIVTPHTGTDRTGSVDESYELGLVGLLRDTTGRINEDED